MEIIDTHCHASPVWYEPVESLLHHMDRSGVERALLVQYKGQFDNTYQFECVRRYPDRLASVVLVDTDQPDAAQTLGQLAEQGAVGVRFTATTRSPGADPLAIWRAAAALGLPVTCNGTAREFADPAFAEILAAVPTVPVIIEHLGSRNQPDGEAAPYPLRRQVFDLARFPNVYIKVHGLGEICDRAYPVPAPFPFARAHLAILEMAYAAFGPERMLWGSDYPPVSSREGYANALRLTWDVLADKGETALEQIFGGVAQVVYRW
jgi:L-fuconolactonase